MILLQFSWRRGAKYSSGPGFKSLFSKDFISAFSILSILAMSFFQLFPTTLISYAVTSVIF